MILSNDLLEMKNSFFAKNSTASEDCFLGFLVWQEKYKFEKVNLQKALKINLLTGFRLQTAKKML